MNKMTKFGQICLKHVRKRIYTAPASQVLKPVCVCRSSFSGQGQFCLASSRIFVQRSVYDTFLKTFVESTR